MNVLVTQFISDSLWPHGLAHQASLSVGFSWQEYWSGLPFPSPGDLPDPGIEPQSPDCRQTLYQLSHRGRVQQIHEVKNIYILWPSKSIPDLDTIGGGKKNAYVHCYTRILTTENSLVVQWLELSAFTVRSAVWISGKEIFRKPHVTAKKMKKGEEKRKQVTTGKDRMMVALGKRGLWSGKGNGDFKEAASVVC